LIRRDETLAESAAASKARDETPATKPSRKPKLVMVALND
jgi:hypothetical protein